jgi:hypothetical protein
MTQARRSPTFSLPIRRRLLVVVLAAAVAGSAVGATTAAFSGQTSNGGNTFQAASSFAPLAAFVKHVGSSTCGSTTSVVTVPAGGVAAQNTLIVRFVQRSTISGAVSVSDSKGNTYSQDLEVVNAGGGGIRTLVFSANVQTALVGGDSITVSHPTSGSLSAAVDEFSGIVAANRVDATGSGIGAGPPTTASVTTTNARDLVVGVLGVRGSPTFTQASGWSGLNSLSPDCGGAGGSSQNHGGYRIVSTTGTYTYNPTISGTDGWAMALVAYKSL